MANTYEIGKKKGRMSERQYDYWASLGKDMSGIIRKTIGQDFHKPSKKKRFENMVADELSRMKGDF